MKLNLSLSVVLENRRAIEHKDAVRWLAPGEDVSLGIDFYKTELTNAYESRQAGSCEWILKHEKYLRWSSASNHDQDSCLWITAIPGAGKTILAAFVTLHHLAIGHKDTFYFFFNSTDRYMTTALSAGKCLLYQLYVYAREAGETSHFDLQSGIEGSGGPKAKSFEAVWDIVVKYAGRLANPVFIIDALDEVAEQNLFLNALVELVQKTSTHVLLTSRHSAVPPAADSKFTLMEFGTEQKHDIESYIESRTAQGLTSSPQIRSTIVKTLVAKNDGMFLWVRLILEELECSYSIEEMELVLTSLPTDLDGVYAKIWKNLSKSLKQSQKEFCHKILIWLFCARRPLSTQELYAAMKSEYARDSFLYTAENISGAICAACGPLVVFRMGSIRLVHFSLKEFMTKSPEQWNTSQQELRDFYIDIKMGNLHILKVCLANFEAMVSTESFIPTNEGSSNIDFDFSLMKDRWPLVEYTSLNWMNHARESGPTQVETLQTLRAFVESKASFIWIYASLAIDVGYMEQFRWSIRSILMLLESHLTGDPLSPRLDNIRRCSSWCKFVEKLISDYGSTLEENPAILFDLSLQSLAQETDFRPTWISDESRTPCRRLALKESFILRPAIEVPAHRQLHMDVTEGREHQDCKRDPVTALGLFRVIKRCGAFVYASYYLSGKPQLLIQECSTGKRLAPITYDVKVRVGKNDSNEKTFLCDSAISEDESTVAVVYGTTYGCLFVTCVWQLKKDISFDPGPFEAQWAQATFHTTTFQPICRGSANLLVFASKYLLWCPAGLVNIATGSVTPHSMMIPGIQSKNDEGNPSSGHIHMPHNLTLYGRGEAIMIHGLSQSGEWRSTERLSLTGKNLGKVVLPLIEETKGQSWGRTRCYQILHTDESGRIIVWATRTGKRRGILLHDSRDGKHVDLTPSTERRIAFSSSATEMFLFVNESDLLIFAIWNQGLDLSISTWDVSSNGSGPSKLASREYQDTLCGMCVSGDRESLYLVTTNRTITRLTLPHLEERENYLGIRDQNQEAIETFPASDGTQIASVRSDQTQ